MSKINFLIDLLSIFFITQVKTEIMKANIEDILLTMRVYDRTAIDKEFLLTVTLEISGYVINMNISVMNELLSIKEETQFYNAMYSII